MDVAKPVYRRDALWTSYPAEKKINKDNKYKYTRMGQILKNQQWHDCTFVVEDQEVKAHKLILACCSPVFETMLFGEMASDRIIITDACVEDFSAMLEYLYTETVEIESVDQAWHLIYLGKKYLLEGLADHCFRYLQWNRTISTLLLSYEQSILYEEETLNLQFSNHIGNYIKEIMLLSNYHVKLETLHCIVTSFKFKTYEWSYIILGIVNWAVEECSKENPTVENVWTVLEENDLSQYLHKFTPLEIYPNLGMDFLNKLDNLITLCNDVYQIYIKDSTRKCFLQPHVSRVYTNVHIRGVYKPFERVQFRQACVFSQYFQADRDCCLTGVAVTRPETTGNLKACKVNITVQDVTGQGQDYSQNGQCEYMEGADIPWCLMELKSVFVMRANKDYRLVVTYNASQQACVEMCSYEEVVRENGGMFRFEYVRHSVIKGFCFCPL